MLTFPEVLRPASGGYAPASRNLGGGQSLTGFEQVVGSMSDRWQASFTFKIRTTAELLALRAFVMAMSGRRNTVALPVFDRARAPWQVIKGRPQSPAVLRFRDLDKTQFADAEDFDSTLIVAEAETAAVAQSTVIDVRIVKGGIPQPGQYLTIASRLYSIIGIALDNPYRLTIWPWLRHDLAAGDPVEFGAPSGEMRFASDDQGADALMGLDLLKFASVTLRFDEAVPVVSPGFELREDGGYELRE